MITPDSVVTAHLGEIPGVFNHCFVRFINPDVPPAAPAFNFHCDTPIPNGASLNYTIVNPGGSAGGGGGGTGDGGGDGGGAPTAGKVEAFGRVGGFPATIFYNGTGNFTAELTFDNLGFPSFYRITINEPMDCEFFEAVGGYLAKGIILVTPVNPHGMRFTARAEPWATFDECANNPTWVVNLYSSVGVLNNPDDLVNVTNVFSFQIIGDPLPAP